MKALRKLFVIILFVFMLTGCIGESSKYTVKFDSMGGTEVEHIVVEKGAEITLPEPPTREGYEFAGWYLSADSEEVFLDKTEITKSLTLYAKWLKLYTVTFVTNCEETVAAAVVTEGRLATEPEVSNEGYTLAGWYTEPAFENQFSFDTPITKDLTLYANWVDSSTVYNVEFVVEGVTYNEVLVQTGTKVAKPTDPERDFFDFVAWMNGEEEYDFNQTVHSNLTLVASFAQNTFVLQTRQNDNYAEFKAKKNDDANDRTTYVKRNVEFLAGDDNDVKFQLVVQLGTDYNYETEEFGRTYYGDWAFDFALQLLVNGTFVDVSDDEYVDAFTSETAGIDFSEAAVGKTFKVIITPRYLTVLQTAADYAVEYEVKVVDGYNVYEAWELLYMDNSDATYNYDSKYLYWAAMKEEKGITYSPNAIILQKDIVFGVADFPSQFLLNDDDESLSPSDSDYARALNSLEDNATFFYHHIEANGEFHLYGNLFGIDVSTIPEVVRENGNITAEGMAISHSQLFYIYGDSTTTSSIEDLSILGNAPKVENKQKAGGLIFAKIQGSTHLTSNVISSGFFITFFPNNTLDPYVVDSCKAYDAFNCFIYNWGSPDVTIKNSELIGCGGPIVLQDHIRQGRPDEAVGTIKFENCNIESYVNGQEGWFTVVGAAALIPLIKQLDAVFNAGGKSFLKTKTDGTNTYTYMNLIVVNKSGSAQGPTGEKIDGSTTIDTGTPFDFGASNPYLAAMLEQAFAAGAPVFQGDTAGATTGYAYFDGSKLCGLDGQAISEYSLYASNYFCLYYNGMGIVMELFDMGQTL